eukprot:g3490.t1
MLVLKNCHFKDNVGNESTLYITDGTTLTISNSSFVRNTGVQGGGAILAIGNVSLTIEDSTVFKGNKAVTQGGALFFKGYLTLRIEDSFFIQNESNFSGGGAIYAENPMNEDLDVNIFSTVFSKNIARSYLGSGGAIRLQAPNMKCTMEQGVSFISNVAELDGGAVHISGAKEIIVRQTSFIGNEVNQGAGAALYVVSANFLGSIIKITQLQIQSSTFFHNRGHKGPRGGGALGLTGQSTIANITKCTFSGNHAESGSGGVLHIFSGPFVTISESNFTDNRAIQGGALHVERYAKVNISECKFLKNHAENGGAISARSSVDINITKSDLKSNFAMEGGGAVHAESHSFSLSEKATIAITNCFLTNNSALVRTTRNAFRNIMPQGGTVLGIGAGQFVNIINSSFHNNSAGQGGAVAIVSTKSFWISNHSIFSSNEADVGGAIFVYVDDSVDISTDIYRISDTTFNNNSAREGGAIWIISSRSTDDLFPFNAYRTSLRVEECKFFSNNASNIGGGMMVRGVGFQVHNSFFDMNLADSKMESESELSGSGGALVAIDGAIADISKVSFDENIARTMGGALFVMDSSVRTNFTNFTRNSVTDKSGNGGAIALMLTYNRILPVREEDPLLFILLECNNCSFVNNSAPLLGGAIYHHHSDPTVNYSKLWDCHNDTNRYQSLLPKGQRLNLSCAWVDGIREGLEGRVVRFSNVTFERNKAQNGGALFTNYPHMINIRDTDENSTSYNHSFINIQENDTFMDKGIRFENNSNLDNGYGPDYATFPVNANFYKDGNFFNSAYLTFSDFRSRGYLKFHMDFRDDFGQNVSFIRNFTVEIRKAGNNPAQMLPTLYGQTNAVFNESGFVNFTGTRVGGKENKSYSLSIHFFHRGQELRMTRSYFIKVKIRPCRIGEVTKEDDNGVIECKPCGTGQFSWNSSRECKSCEGIEGVECHGSTAVPKDHYWHSSSFSRNMLKCIYPGACKYDDRNRTITEAESEAHSNNTRLFYGDEDSVQCAPGYKGIRCGTCEENYGKVGEQCQACESKARGSFFLSLMVLWSIVFVGFFIRSVLQLSKRIEFNKKYVGSTFQGRREEIPEPAHERNLNQLQIEDSEICPDEISHLAFEMSTSQEGNTSSVSTSRLHSYIQASHPAMQDWTTIVANRRSARSSIKKSKKRSRLIVNPRKIRNRKETGLVTRFQRLKSVGSSRDLKPLTLVNPASEVLKIMINFLQLTSVAIFINIPWSEVVRNVLDAIGTMANLSTGGGYFSLDCFSIPHPFAKSLWRMVILVLYPFFIFIIFVMIWALRTLIKRKTMKYFRHRIWLAFLAIIYFFYIGLTKNLLRFFVCFDIKDDVAVERDSTLEVDLAGHHWEEDTSVQCYKNDHLLLVLCFVVPLLFLITIGYPVGTFLILQLKATKLEDENVVCTYGFLYQAYNKHYWEVTIMFRKAAIAAVTVFPQELGANVQGLLCLLILFVSLVCHLFFRPFKKEVNHLNQLESFSLSATIGVFFSGLVFNDPKTGGITEVFLSVLAILCVLGTLLLMFFHLITSSEEVLDMLLLEKGVMDSDQLSMETVSTKLKQLYLHYVSAVGKLLQFLKRNRSTQIRQERRTRTSVQLADYA